jgi:hypothetical protein
VPFPVYRYGFNDARVGKIRGKKNATLQKLGDIAAAGKL